MQILAADKLPKKYAFSDAKVNISLFFKGN